MSRSPKISVLIPVFNAKPFLAEALDSILAQTFDDFELLIIDDGSCDGTREVLAEYARRDMRLKVHLKENNTGIADTLNKGIGLCRGEYIARMDGDDVALPDRLRRQCEFMDRSPGVGVSGTWYSLFGEANGIYTHPVEDAQIRVHHLLRGTAIGHPTAIIRRRVLIESGITYPNVAAHDLWFWVRLGFVTKLANIPEVLLHYRVHPNQFSGLKHLPQNVSAAQAQAFFASKILGRPLTALQAQFHRILAGWDTVSNQLDLEHVTAYSADLQAANVAVGLLDPELLRREINKRLTEAPQRYAEQRYKYSDKYDLSLLLRFLWDPLRPFRNLALRESLRFVAKCVLHHVPRRP